jgi:hypothetical protein
VCARARALSYRLHFGCTGLQKNDSCYSELLQTKAIGELLGILVPQDKADEVAKMQQFESSSCDVLLL